MLIPKASSNATIFAATGAAPARNLARRAELVSPLSGASGKNLFPRQGEQFMNCLRLMSIAPANLQVQTKRRQERTTKRRRIAMPKFHNNFSLAKASLSLALLLFASIATLGAFAQESSSPPLVYSVENTAANN